MNDRSPQIVGAGETDIGLRNFMVGTYRYMAMAMAVAAAVSYLLSQYFMANPQAIQILANPIVMIGLFFGIMFAFAKVGKNINRMSETSMFVFLFAMAGVLGAFFSLSVLFYPGMLIAKVFFMTVALFASLSLFGYSTERNLWSIAKYAAGIFMAVIALYMVSMVIPAFQIGGTMDLVLSTVALIAISVLVAWETQAMKAMYYGAVGNPSLVKKLALFGATSLLLSFYNMFQFLLNIMGSFGE